MSCVLFQGVVYSSVSSVVPLKHIPIDKLVASGTPPRRERRSPVALHAGDVPGREGPMRLRSHGRREGRRGASAPPAAAGHLDCRHRQDIPAGEYIFPPPYVSIFGNLKYWDYQVKGMFQLRE